MTERRSRKVVNYTYDCDDSDDDDFHSTKPAKRTKTETIQSSNCRSTDSSCRTKSDKPSVSRLNVVKNHSDKSSINLPTSSQSSSASSPERHSPDKENCRANDGSNRNRTLVVSLQRKESIIKTSSVEGIRDSQSGREEDIEIMAGNQPTLITRTTESSDESFAALTKVDNDRSNAPKRTQLGTKRDSDRKVPAEPGQGIIGTSRGLRMGLSRNAKVKSLHGSVRG